MSLRILLVASLHHPQQLLRDQAAARENDVPLPLFPTSMSQHFWEKALRKRGYEVDVFWRNLPGFGGREVANLQAEKYTERITPERVWMALNARLPYTLNVEYRQRNQNLLQQAEAFQPDIVWMVGDNRIIHADTLAAIKARHGSKILYVTGTSPIVFSLPIERQAAALYDLVLVNDYYHGIQWLELGAQEMICLPFVAIDPEFHVARQPLPEDRCDIGFVGTLLPANLYSERVQALESLRGFDLGIWSVHDLPETLRPFQRGSALGEEMLRVLSAAKISLNVHGNFMRYGGNMRLFEAAAVGAFQLVDDRPGVRQWFTEGEHLVMYESLDDLREKAAYYLAHDEERERISAAGRAHVLAHHTSEQRLDALETWLST
ncbi:MAG: glycosyltransferase [Anaerolineae bacterium]|nr:glycosyltransferase [Anaerolineae bacterium]